MGKQVNFYMVAEDEASFVEFLRSDPDVCIFKDRTPTEDIHGLDGLPERGGTGWFKVWLWNRGTSPQPKLRWIPEQEHYIIDPMPHEVIEFARSYQDAGKLVRGRLWVEFSGWDSSCPQEIIKKGEAFRKWYNRLADWIKRKGQRNPVGDYVMPAAAQFAKSSGDLVQMVFVSGRSVPEKG